MSELDLGQTIRGFVSGQKVFERYVLRSLVGRGGMGVVWRAFDEHLERDVALKFLPELIMHDRAVLDDLKRETKRNLDLTHHHIVRIYDFAQDSQSACISMEFVDGETLSALRIDRPEKVFQPQELLQPIAELCEALTYAHTRASIVHRDLKPANLMLTSKGELKVTDFGIARSLSDSISMLTMNRGVSGTLLYMSPQQLDGERASTLDDIYSVGATIYELLTSKPPFYSGGVERQIHEKVPPPMSVRRSDLGIISNTPISETWEQTVADCLAKDPARRPQSAAGLAERFRAIAAPFPVAISAVPSMAPPPVQPKPTIVVTPAESPPTPIGKSHPSSIPKPLLYGTIATALLLLGGLVLYFRAPTSAEIADRLAAIPTPTRAVNAVSSPTIAPTSPPAAVSTPDSTAAAQQSASYSPSDGFDPGIALVDMNRIFKEYSRTKDAEQKINKAKDRAKDEYDDRTTVYKTLLAEINSLNSQIDSSSLSATAKTARSKERDEKIAKVKAMEKEINDFRTTREKALQEQATQMRTEIVNEMTREIASLNPASKSIVYDRSGNSLNGVPVLVFAPESVDVSNKMIAALNQNGRTAFTVSHNLSLGAVDMNGIFKSYNKTKDAEAKINEAKSAAKKEYDDRADSYKKAIEGINSLNTRLDSPSNSASTKGALTKERDDAIKKVKEMEKEINEFRQTREKQLQEQALRMREALVKEITDSIGKGIDRSSAVILDVSGMSTSGVPVAAYVSGVPDISTEVIAALNGTNRPGAGRFSTSLARAQSLRFGVIDMNRAFKAWPGTKPDETTINEMKDATRKKQLQDEATKRREEIVAQIVSALKVHAGQENFNLVFDSSGPSMNGIPITVLNPGIPDLTDKVLKK